MKFSCLQENLSKGLQTVSKAIPAKGPLPILTNVLISAEEGRLKLSATDLETTIITHVGASVDEEGSTTVPARLLKDFIGNLSPTQIEAKLENDILFITSKKNKAKFNGTGSQDFPELPSLDNITSCIEIDPKEFADAVSVVAFASATDTNKPIFSGIYVKFDKESSTLTIASTDGFRLSEKVVPFKSEGKSFSTIIPARTLLEVSKIFTSSQESLKIAVNEDSNLAAFYSEDTQVFTRVLDGQYPDYKKIIPKERQYRASFNADDFMEAIKLTNIFLKEGDGSKTMKIRLDPEGILKITSMESESGYHESEIQAEIEGELLEIAFNAKYLLDFLSNVKCQTVIFETTGNKSACIFKPQETEGYVHVIMPIQI